jgi:hypothetical protein
MEERIAHAVLEAMSPLLVELAQADAWPAPSAGDRAWAEACWRELKQLPAAEQRAAASLLRGDERCWALAIRLCEASADAAARNASEAVRLAQLGVALASDDPRAGKWRHRLLGYCEPFLANARGWGGAP